jgi:hypothetical protein
MIKLSEKGMMLVTILMLTFLLVMLTTSMILISSQNLNMTGLAEKKAKALQAAEAGVDYALYQFYDTSWGTSITSDITESLGDGQSFTIVFNPSEPYHSKNNLMNKDPNGLAPSYGAVIISKGSYGGIEKVMRAIFLRDDELPYPLSTEGEIWLEAWAASPTDAIYNIKGKNTTNPGRMHANKDIHVRGNDGATIDLYSGFASSSGTVDFFRVGNSVREKEKTVPLNIPDIDVPLIISGRPSCHNITQDRFYIVGYFEYSEDAYCVPHAAPLPVNYWWIRDLTSSYGGTYRLGIASFQPRTPGDPCRNLMNDYGNFYYNPVGCPNRNFYNYYPPPGSITFWDSADPNFAAILQNNLNMTLLPPDSTTDPNCVISTLRLDDNLYIDGTTGLFNTSWIGNAPGYYYPSVTVDHQIRLDLNNHKIYANKNLYLGMPVTGTGAIISNETVDFMLSSDPNLVILSKKSVNMTYKESYLNQNPRDFDLSYKGIIYAKDNILIHSNTGSGALNIDIKGSLIAKDGKGNNTQNPPMSRSQYASSNMNVHAFTTLNNHINILHTDDGLDTVVALRGNNFKVRKHFCEVLK